jgi:hypothetical protein
MGRSPVYQHGLFELLTSFRIHWTIPLMQVNDEAINLFHHSFAEKLGVIS